VFNTGISKEWLNDAITMLCRHYNISSPKRIFTSLQSHQRTKNPINNRNHYTPNAPTTTLRPRPLTTKHPAPIRTLPIAEEILPRRQHPPTSSPSTQDDIANALREHFSWKTPVIIRAAVLSSDACRKWTNLEYLQTTVGENTPCEVEIGAGYNDPSISKPSIPFESYIDYIRLFEETYYVDDDGSRPVPPPEEMVYCAQNVLFDGLTKDFTVPSFLSDKSYGVGDGALYDCHVYFGPRGSMSPLHYDPMDNVILQFVGEKRVLLFPQTTLSEDEEEFFLSTMRTRQRQGVDWYYAGEEGQQYNTSPIDVEEVDWERYPRFRMAPPALEGVLRAGDLLYVPKRWWHHVRNLERSLAINCFWH